MSMSLRGSERQGEVHRLSAVEWKSGPSLASTRPILIVDDDPTARRFTSLCLAESGLTNPTVEVADGRQAIAELQRGLDDTEIALPVLVLLDLQMPVCSGAEVARWMRDTPRLARIPVIVLTGDDDAGSVISLYRLGVRSYLVKPVGFTALAAVVRDLEMPWTLT